MKIKITLIGMIALSNTALARGTPKVPYKIDTHHHFLPGAYRTGSYTRT
jgi:hypothetical protein